MAKKAKKARAKAKSSPARKSPGKVKLTMMTGAYEIVRALADGTVKPKGIELVVEPDPGVAAMHQRMAAGKGCDVNEFNGGAYVVLHQQGRRDMTAIPVFLHRRFRHGFIYINRSRGIHKPSDLVGKRIACNGGIGAAANYWMRGFLEDFGVPYRSVTWVIDREDETSRGVPKDVKLELVSRDKSLDQRLLDGDIEGMISASVTDMIDKGDPRVGRLWPNYKEIEAAYYKRTGLFPIMHVTTVPSEVVARHPWVVESLVHAFEEAKQLAFKRLINPRIVPLAWFRSQWEEERAMLGDDPWSYGLSAANMRNLDRMVEYVHDQVLSGPRPKLVDLFPREAFQLELPLPAFHKIDNAY
jgi:4,5-dihydroxyphthalate decarboxylase